MKSDPLIDVGAQDPELTNSPIADEMDDEYEVLWQEVDDQSLCYFNSTAYPHDSYVRSGTSLLVCNKGVWQNAQNSDPDNV